MCRQPSLFAWHRLIWHPLAALGILGRKRNMTRSLSDAEDNSLVDILNACLLFQIPSGRRSVLEAYGEVLLRGWRHAVGPCLLEVENSLIQVCVDDTGPSGTDGSGALLIFQGISWTGSHLMYNNIPALTGHGFSRDLPCCMLYCKRKFHVYICSMICQICM